MLDYTEERKHVDTFDVECPSSCGMDESQSKKDRCHQNSLGFLSRNSNFCILGSY